MPIDMRTNVLSGGNVDTEAGGQGQAFSTPTNNAMGTEDLYNHNAWKGDWTGNANTDMGQWRLPERHGGVYYNELGQNPAISSVPGAYNNMMGWNNPYGAPTGGLVNQLMGGGGPQMQKMDYYQQLGQQLRSALQGPQGATQPQQSAPLTAGFDQNWLMTQTNAGSANGATLGGSGGGGGGGGAPKREGDPEAGVKAGSYGGIGNIQPGGGGMGTGE